MIPAVRTYRYHAMLRDVHVSGTVDASTRFLALLNIRHYAPGLRSITITTDRRAAVDAAGSPFTMKG